MIIKTKRKYRKRKVSVGTDYFCRERIEVLSYRDVTVIKRFINDQGRINPQIVTKLLRKHQRQVTLAIKRARHMALIPFRIIEREEREVQ